jgi:hypothetical protein
MVEAAKRDVERSRNPERRTDVARSFQMLLNLARCRFIPQTPAGEGASAEARRMD